MDIIGKIHPPSSKRHSFILVATDYFKKWIEAVPLTNVTYQEVIKFIKEHIIHRYGIPQTITTDQGTVFTSDRVAAFAAQYGITLLHLFSYYVQANRQYRSKATDCTQFQLLYRQEAILLLEITVPSLRVLKQNFLNPEQYDTNMLQRLDDVHGDWMMALENIQVNKVKMAQAYNKKYAGEHSMKEI
ncbi:uncharacterized protein LOC127261129 [Andrographis paniculata]|uniref:uncharacterized protein LOC127261129 n=1 Tax=Andrographis paniculata TaxID=175694 RepID=UPI0021E77717|nr:uncharacterized protein LOC127261129 [Andrographis paniculata]